MGTDITTVTNDAQCLYDEWPKLPDGVDWDGTDLLGLVRDGQNPFGDALDVRALVREIESSINIEITDIPIVSYGANHFVSCTHHLGDSIYILIRSFVRASMLRPPLGD